MSDKKEDTYSYKGWLVSDSFMKRALAITGYALFGQLIICVICMLPVMLLAMMGGIISMAVQS